METNLERFADFMARMIEKYVDELNDECDRIAVHSRTQGDGKKEIPMQK